MAKIQKQYLQSNIIEYIKEYIEENNLKTGDKFPSQMKLIEILGVSRASIREAFKTLEAHNILKVVNGKGVFVENGSPNTISAQIEIGKEKESLLELLEVRKVMEKGIIHLVCENATEEEIDDIYKELIKLETKFLANEKQDYEDKSFHRSIYKCCHNTIMLQLIISLDSLFNKIWSYPLGMKKPFTETFPLHQELYYWIKNRNVKKAQSVNDKIINQVSSDIKKYNT